MTLITIITFILLPILLLYKAEWKNENKEFLSFNQTTQIKGVFAIFVMLVHFSQRMANAGPMAIFKNPGYIAVGGFFFLSGYGLYSSYIKNKEISLKKSFFRIVQIYKPFIFITAIYMIINVFYLGNSYAMSDVLLYLINIKQVDPITWYLLTMVYFYMAFHLSYRYFKNEKSEIALFLMSFFYLIVLIILKEKDIWWYNTSFMFFIGSIFKKYETIVKEKVMKREFIIIGVALILFGIHIILFRENVVSQSILTIVFILAFMILNIRIKYNSKVFMFLGIISYEIYLVHLKLFNIIFNDRIFGKNGNSDFIIFFISSIVISAIVYGILNINKILKERRKVK